MSPLDNLNVGKVCGVLVVLLFYATVHACVYGVAYGIGIATGFPAVFVLAVLWLMSFAVTLDMPSSPNDTDSDRIVTWLWILTVVIARLWAVFYLLRMVVPKGAA